MKYLLFLIAITPIIESKPRIQIQSNTPNRNTPEMNYIEKINATLAIQIQQTSNTVNNTLVKVEALLAATETASTHSVESVGVSSLPNEKTHLIALINALKDIIQEIQKAQLETSSVKKNIDTSITDLLNKNISKKKT